MARGQLRFDSSDEAMSNSEIADALAAFGLQCDSSALLEQDEFWLWPENEEPFGLWRGLQTQWVVSMAGAVGLNYASVEADLRMLGVRKQRRREFYILIKHMEQATLEEWAAKR